MASFIDPANGDLATAEHVAQLVEDFSGLRNIPIAISGINDPAQYALTLKNAGTGSRDLIAYAADGTTVLLQVDATGVTLGAPVNVPPGSISGTAIAAGSITNAMLGADVARDNQLANGGFEIWQRGTGPFTANGAFLADRWSVGLSGTDTLSVSKDTANRDTGSIACAACVFVLGTGGGASNVGQTLRISTDGYQFAGKTISLSVRVRTSTANAVRLRLASDGTGAAQVFSSFHSGGGAYETLTAPACAIPSDATFIVATVVFAASCTAYLDNAMLVVGSQAANYVPMHPADDLARCKRYYDQYGGSFSADIYVAATPTAGTQGMGITLPTRQQMPVMPTVTKVGTWAVTNSSQPAVTPGLSTFVVTGTSIAAGIMVFNTLNATTYITLESNP